MINITFYRVFWCSIHLDKNLFFLKFERSSHSSYGRFTKGRDFARTTDGKEAPSLKYLFFFLLPLLLLFFLLCVFEFERERERGGGGGGKRWRQVRFIIVAREQELSLHSSQISMAAAAAFDDDDDDDNDHGKTWEYNERWTVGATDRSLFNSKE